MPIAYYPTFLRYHLPGTTDFNFFHFWWRTLTVGPWPSGPAWFLWVLLALDVIAWRTRVSGSPSLAPGLCMSRWLASMLFALAALTCSFAPASAAYPDRVIRIVVPFAPGGGVEVRWRG